jgi:hypothetical protein
VAVLGNFDGWYQADALLPGEIKRPERNLPPSG